MSRDDVDRHLSNQGFGPLASQGDSPVSDWLTALLLLVQLGAVSWLGLWLAWG